MRNRTRESNSFPFFSADGRSRPSFAVAFVRVSGKGEECSWSLHGYDCSCSPTFPAVSLLVWPRCPIHKLPGSCHRHGLLLFPKGGCGIREVAPTLCSRE